MFPWIRSLLEAWDSLEMLQKAPLGIAVGLLFYVCFRLVTVLILKRWMIRPARLIGDRWEGARRRILMALHLATALAAVLIILGLLEVGARAADALRVLLLLSVVYLVVESLGAFLTAYYLHRPDGRKIPALVMDIGKTLVYVILLIWLLGTVAKINLTSLLTTSAIFSLIIGLALQDTLGNLFAGLSMQIDSPFRIGDWVLLENRPCKVLEMNWRSVKVVTRTNDIIILPNNSIAKMSIVNYYGPQRRHRCTKRIGVSYDHPPNMVVSVLIQTALQFDEVLKDPSPSAFLVGYNDFAIEYEFRFWIRDYEYTEIIQDKVFRRVWYQFRRNGIRIPYPIRDVYVREPVQRRHQIEEVKIYLKRVDFLASLRDEELEMIAEDVSVEHFSEGETLIRQGEQGDTFYIVRSGRVQVFSEMEGQQRELIAEMGPGHFFGEFSLLTGERRSATITAVADCEVFLLQRETFQKLLAAHPEVTETISTVLAARMAEREQHLELRKKRIQDQIGLPPKATEIPSEATLRDRIFQGIRAIFDL